MKRIRAVILTLVLSISMLAPDFATIPAVYAVDETPAAEQTVDGAGVAAGSTDAEAGSAAESGAASEGASEADAADPGASGYDKASDATSEPDKATAEGADQTDASAAEDANIEEAAADPDNEDSALLANDATEDASIELKAQTGETVSAGAYDKIWFTDLDDAKALQISEDLQDKIDVSHTQYGNGVLLKGKVKDLNKLRISIGKEFSFDAGSVGRLTFNGLKDKDAGMTVQTLIYMDDSSEPVSSFELRKQMGKKEWANDAERSVSLASEEISGKHSISLGFKVTGKDEDKKTSIDIKSLQFCKTTIPVMYFNIDESEGTIQAMNSSDDHSVECYGSVDLIVPDEFNADETFRSEYGKQNSLTGLKLEYIRGRGNSTWTADKKPYKVKFDKKQDLFGFGKNKHWVLLANRFDNSLVRNRLTYWLGQQLGMEYTPQCVPVEVVMNGEFYGSYLLCEQIRVGEGRVSIDDLDDIKDVPAITDPLINTGGYLLSMDYADDEDRSFTTENGMQLYIESPDDNVKHFSDYIKAYTQKVENAIFGDDFKDESGNPYTEYLDMDSAVDYWWVQEFSENGDAYGSGSTYLYKKRDEETGKGKLYWGPLWDFDYVAWGDLEYDAEPAETLDYTNNTWFDMLKSDPEFIAKVKARWTEKGGLKEEINEITKKGGLLDKYKAQLKDSYDYDHALWGANESEYMEYEPEIEQLRTWITRRAAYVDGAVKELKVEKHKVSFVIDGKTVKTVTANGFLRATNFPEAPEKKGKVFVGWLTEDGEEYTEGSRVYEDLVLTASYIKDSEVLHAKEILFKDYDVYHAVYESGHDFEEWYFQNYRIMPDGATEQEISWTSSDENVAKPDEDGGVTLKNLGDATITARLKNGVSKSYKIHVVNYKDMNECEDWSISTESLKLKPGEYRQITVNAEPKPCEMPEIMWLSSDEEVAYVDDIGVVSANGAGTTEILAVNSMTREIKKCKVTVTDSNVVKTVKYKGSTYKITSDKSKKRTAMLVKAKKKGIVTIPATVKCSGRKYSVNKIGPKAFAKSKTTKVIIKTKNLSKARVRKSLKGSKVKTIKVKVGKKKVNKKYVKKYKKIFTKKNAGKKVKVS